MRGREGERERERQREGEHAPATADRRKTPRGGNEISSCAHRERERAPRPGELSFARGREKRQVIEEEKRRARQKPLREPGVTLLLPIMAWLCSHGERVGRCMCVYTCRAGRSRN